MLVESVPCGNGVLIGTTLRTPLISGVRNSGTHCFHALRETPVVCSCRSGYVAFLSNARHLKIGLAIVQLLASSWTIQIRFLHVVGSGKRKARQRGAHKFEVINYKLNVTTTGQS